MSREPTTNANRRSGSYRSANPPGTVAPHRPTLAFASMLYRHRRPDFRGKYRQARIAGRTMFRQELVEHTNIAPRDDHVVSAAEMAESQRDREIPSSLPALLVLSRRPRCCGGTSMSITSASA
jgi:hypothetical protein